VTGVNVKGDLHGYLRGAREVMLWKLDGLDEYDIRRPLTPTGTNLLGLVKHNACTHLRYFGDVFGRPHNAFPTWLSDDAEMWATPDESTADIVSWYRSTWRVADETIDELALDAVGRVPWWGDSAVTLHHVLVHVTAETQRHAGHADIVRELIDGSAGLLDGHHNLRIFEGTAQREFRDQVEHAARLAGGR
jgi:hypothetical protein